MKLFLVMIAAYVALLAIPLGDFGSIDLLQYWSAAKLIMAGQNPYNVSALLEIQRTATPETAAMINPIIIWNPPLIFIFILPLALFSFQESVRAWLVLSITCFLAATSLSTEVSSGRILKDRKLLIYILSFYPFLLCLEDGQISFILLIALCVFLRLKDEKPILAGFLLSFTLIKPHLLFLVYAYLLTEAFNQKKYGIIQGIFLGAALLTIFPLLLNPEIYTFYQQHIAAPPYYWQTPTLGSWLQKLALHLGKTSWIPEVRYLPSIAALIGVLYLLIRNGVATFENRTKNILLLIPLSLFMNPYGWVFDQILILPFGLFILKEEILSRKPWVFGALILCNLSYFIPGTIGQELYAWYPAAIFLIGLQALKLETNDKLTK